MLLGLRIWAPEAPSLHLQTPVTAQPQALQQTPLSQPEVPGAPIFNASQLAPKHDEPPTQRQPFLNPSLNIDKR